MENKRVYINKYSYEIMYSFFIDQKTVKLCYQGYTSIISLQLYRDIIENYVFVGSL